MAFEGLSDRLEGAFKRLKSKGSLNEQDVREAMREVRLALLEADVSYKVAKDFTAKVTERAIGAQVMSSLTPAQSTKNSRNSWAARRPASRKRSTRRQSS